MNGRPLPLNVGYYDTCTPTLTTEQHGALLLLMMHCWGNGGAVPYDHQQLSGIAKVRNEKRWLEIVWPAIRGYFVTCDDGQALRNIFLGLWGPMDSVPRLDVGKSAWARMRRTVFERDGFSCRYCGEGSLEQPHCDHVVPRVHGGPSSLENLVTSCGRCNISKGGKRLEEWQP